jgi:hypothetical protein
VLENILILRSIGETFSKKISTNTFLMSTRMNSVDTASSAPVPVPGTSLRTTELMSRGAMQRYAARICSEQLQMVYTRVPPDGHCAIHAVTRGLGLSPPSGWRGEHLSRWARAFRSHFARYCAAHVDKEFFDGFDFLEIDHLLLIARLWKIRIFVYSCQAIPDGTVTLWPPIKYPLENVGNLLPEIHLVYLQGYQHFDLLIPSVGNFTRQICGVKVPDLALFEGSHIASQLFDRFIEMWLDFLMNPPPLPEGYTYAIWDNIHELMESYDPTRWPRALRFRVLSNTVGIFAASVEDIPSDFLIAQGLTLSSPDALVLSSGGDVSLVRPFTR